MAAAEKRWNPVDAGMKLLIADDVVKARKRMRNAWIAGLVWAALVFAGGVTAFFGGVDSRGEPLLSSGHFAFGMTEAGLVATLSFGVLRRIRMAAALLFAYYAVNRLVALSMGLEINPMLPVKVLFAYLFFQGMRGALTFHHLTHPLPTEPHDGHEPAAGDGTGS